MFSVGPFVIWRSIITNKWHVELVIIKNPIIIFLLKKIYYIIYKLPYFKNGEKIMHWILKHTPADEDERK